MEQIRKREIHKNLVVYEKGMLRVWGGGALASGYGWLAYRAVHAFPSHLSADVWVMPPSDASAIMSYLKQRGEILTDRDWRLCLCAVDGTKVPWGWKHSIDEDFDGVILMVNHSGMEQKCPKYLGEFYPLPRTAFVTPPRYWQPPQQKVIGSVVTYHYRKGIDLLISLIWRIYKKDPSVRFKLVLDCLLAEMIKGGLPPTVEVLSNISDEEMVEFYLSLWAFVSLSMGEGGALPVAEAAFLGVPVITPHHTAFSRLPASVRVSCVPQLAPIDAHFAGEMFVANLNEVEEVILRFEVLPPPSGGSIEFENLDFLSALCL